MSEENDSDDSYTDSEEDDNTPPMDFDYDSDSKEYSSTAISALADIQSELDECVSNGEMKEGTYIRVSKKLKESIDRDDTRAYIDYYLDMVLRGGTSRINTYAKGINPLDVKIISAVIKMALREKLTKSWWACALGNYTRMIFLSTDVGVDFQERARAFLKLAAIPSCEFKFFMMTECNQRFPQMCQTDGCFVCYFEKRGVDKSIIEEILIKAPLLYVNVHGCKKKHMHGIDTSHLKKLAWTGACRCNWVLPRFGRAVGHWPSECHTAKFGRDDVHLTADLVHPVYPSNMDVEEVRQRKCQFLKKMDYPQREDGQTDAEYAQSLKLQEETLPHITFEEVGMD